MMKDEMNQPFVELQDVCRFISGGTPSTKVPEYFTGTIPWITGADMNGNVITKARQYITEEAIENSATNIVPKGNILLVTRTGVGKVAIAGVDICISQDFTGLELDKAKVDEWYLLYYLRSQEEALTSQQRGATIQGITRDVVETLKIPLPPLTEQKRIASLLARADRLRQLRRTAHELGESLLQSVFLEMFGDLRFPEIPLSELCHFITKGTTPQSSDIKDYPFDSNDVPFLKVYHLTDTGKVDFDYSPSWVSNSIHNGLLNRSKVYPNDILMNIVGPPLGNFGIVPSTHQEWNVNQAIAIFRAKDKVKPIYLLHALMYPKILEKLLKQAVGIRQLNLSLEQCRDFRIPVPPLSLQEEFAGVVARVESLRGSMSESTRQVDGLFESLLQEAFA